MTSRADTEATAGRGSPLPALAHGNVVVGFDDGEASRAAVRWATIEAARLGSTVTVLSAADPPVRVHLAPGMSAPDPRAPDLLRVSRLLAARGVALARSSNPAVGVVGRGVVGGPAGELVACSSDAGLVVVGRSRSSVFQAATLGSVSFAVAMHARCPVVVVREGADRHPGPSWPVVVGVDGSRPSLVAVALAADFARAWDAPLRIVCAWPSSSLDAWPEGLVDGGVVSGLGHTSSSAAQAAVDEAVAQVRAADVEQDVTGTVAEGRAEEVLVYASQEAGLVVVGSRGRGGFAGLMLGSVSHGVMRRAESPVAVVRQGSM